ncbi:centromere protein L-like [Pecten maximus]|uniref:centromere protein L-like n=1 Tax=Pecten maximus TaxID=6579 RepID=UPI001457FACE|nr:centromere protein L-like [Pecten maximus]XP_033754987.1 centromere protein L-like [Pecten maximus]XP_033754988.1 centromere protein L-like [Pecten maximus]
MTKETSDQTPTNRIGKSLVSRSIRRSTRRYTPYGKTPQSRRITVKEPVSRLQRTPTSRRSGRKGDKDEPKDFKGLTMKTWRSFKLTPLYGFSTNPRDLKKIANILSAHIEAEKRKGIFMDNTLMGKAYISVYKDLKVTDVDPEAIQIVVKGKNPNGEDIIQLTAVLCGVDMQENHIKSTMRDNFTYFPVMLVKASVTMSSAVISWLEMQYDCKVTPLTLSSYDLAWMVSMWSGMENQKGKTKPVELLYSVPKECEGLTSINYSIDPEDCKDLWERIHDKDEIDFTSEEVQVFIRCLEAHFFRVFKVKVSAMSLVRIGTPVCMVGTDGRLKIFLSDKVHVLLRHLTELAMGHTFTNIDIV